MKKIRLMSLILCLAACFSLCSCVNVGDVPDIEFDGKYILFKATKNGADCTDEFEQYTVEVSNGFVNVVIVHNGQTTRRNNSTFTVKGDTVTEQSSFTSDKFVYRGTNSELKTTFNGYEIVLVRFDPNASHNDPVDFESVLFGDSIDEVKIFNYCPAILVEEKDGEEIMNIWYCTNKDDGVIMDHIGYRTGVKQADGKWIFSNEKIVIEPTPGTWDGRHTCDPAVIKGEFAFKGENYNYLMSYLGCVTEDYQKNETGLAVAKDVGGPWVKVNVSEPLIPWYDDGDYDTEQAKYESYKGTSNIYWGTGMPALINVDGKGEVLMFYASTLRGIGVRRYDFSNLDSPVLKFTSSLRHQGVINSAGNSCRIGIPDFAYDSVNKRLYCASVTNEKNPADYTPTRVNSHSMLLCVENLNSMEEVCSALQNGSYTWKPLGYVGPSATGWNRNHNPGLVRNGYGYIPDASKIGIVVSTGRNDYGNDNIFTYRLFGHWFDVTK